MRLFTIAVILFLTVGCPKNNESSKETSGNNDVSLILVSGPDELVQNTSAYFVLRVHNNSNVQIVNSRIHFEAHNVGPPDPPPMAVYLPPMVGIQSHSSVIPAGGSLDIYITVNPRDGPNSFFVFEFFYDDLIDGDQLENNRLEILYPVAIPTNN